MPQDKKEEENLSGTVYNVVYHNPDNGYIILKADLDKGKTRVTIVGYSADLHPGSFILAVGSWQDNPQYGRQFQASTITPSMPNSLEGIERFLSSGVIAGIGPAYAKRLVKAFGEDVFDVFENNPKALSTIKGLGKQRLEKIQHSWSKRKSVHEIMVFLHSHGIGAGRAAHIFRVYGKKAIAKITQDPYCLARDIKGIGFRLADVVAQKLGTNADSPSRILAAIAFLLDEANGQGHCGVERSRLVDIAADLLTIAPEKITHQIDLSLRQSDLICDHIDGQVCIFPKKLYLAECFIAQRLKALSTGQPPWPNIDADKAIAWAEEKTHLKLADSQCQALDQALHHRLFIITGGPGVGKTTMLMTYLAILQAKNVRIQLCAPTGRAARRLSETTGIEAQTIHRLLEINPATGFFRRDSGQPLDADLVVVDETSMVDVMLLAALLRALPDHAGLLLVGDADQLPPVGPGQPFASCLSSAKVPHFRLLKIFRQADESQIILNAHRINQATMPETSPDDKGDFFFIESKDSVDAHSKIIDIVCHRLKRRYGFNPIRDIQVLAPMNRGALGVDQLNQDLRQRLNPPTDHGTNILRDGDKIMQIENNYDKDVYNGDIGFVREVNSDGEVLADFEGRQVFYTANQLDQLRLAYAITIHKSQGSEYPAVVIPLTMQHYLMLRRDLVYTAITRGKLIVVIVGERRALARAVGGQTEDKRLSMLEHLLQT